MSQSELSEGPLSAQAYSMNSLGEPELEDEWAMVEGAAQLYNFRDSRDLAAQLHPSRMDNFSEEGETLRQRMFPSFLSPTRDVIS